jgi:Flp pilus assembly CpaF family ATPase
VGCILDTMLEPLQPYLTQNDILELNVNSPGEVALEKVGTGYVYIENKKLDRRYWELLCNTLSNVAGTSFHPDHQPRVSTELPGGHRFEAMVGNHIASKLSVSIRMRRKVAFDFADYGVSDEIATILVDVVQNSGNIMISGGTSSGKTTFFNKLIEYIPLENRVLTVEDTREVYLPHKNQCNYILSRNEEKPVIGYKEMIDHMMRSRPDSILVGELSIANTFPIIRLLNSGHGGFICSLHSNSPQQAIEVTIPQNVQLSGFNPAGIDEFLYEAIDVVVQLHRVGQKRYMTEVMYPKLGKSKKLFKDEVSDNIINKSHVKTDNVVRLDT